MGVAYRMNVPAAGSLFVHQEHGARSLFSRFLQHFFVYGDGILCSWRAPR